MVLQNDGTVVWVANTDDGATGIFAGAIGHTMLPVGQWSFVTCVINQANNQVRLYVNGVLDATDAMGGRIIRNRNRPFRIGKQIGQQANLSFNGSIDDVRIYNRVLSVTEIQELYLQQSTNLNSGLVAYYPLNGNANDVSGNGLLATINGPAPATDRNGNPASAYAFNGYPDFIAINDPLAKLNFDARSENYTVALWAKLNSLSGGDKNFILDRGTPQNQPSSYAILFSHLQKFAVTVWDGVSDINVFSTTTPVTGQWYQLTLVVKDGALHFFVNGIEESPAQILPNNYQTTKNTEGIRNIGRYAGNGFGNYLNGVIDDVRIYNRALSASEIHSLYIQAYLGPVPTPPTLTQTNRTPLATEIGNKTNGVLKVFTNGAFVSGAAIDPSKKTIVLTHGWNSNSDDWPSNMASQFVAAGISANIVAWDWRCDAKSDITLTFARAVLLKTPAQGYAFGTNLMQNLGAGYNQPIHFIGHSFGTEVNAAAANYLEANGCSWANIQMTLLDEAEIANLTKVSPTTFNLSWIKPLPTNFAWSDNYITLVGDLQVNAKSVNIFLTEGQPGVFYINANNLLDDMKAYHSFPCLWYGQTIVDPAGSVMGNIWSFERNSNFTSPAGGTYFEQQGSGLVLNQIPQAIAGLLHEGNLTAFIRDLGVYGTLKTINIGVSIVGDVTANVIETALSDPYPIYQTTPATVGISSYATASPDYWSPKLVLQNHPLNIQPNLKTFKANALDESSSMPSNSPAYAWLPMTIPTNATSMSFDFMLQGDGASDSFEAAVNGTNIFSLAASLIQTNVMMNSGLIDVSQYAGTNVELFLGIVGGTSTNTSLTVSGIRLYSIASPSLQAQASGNNFVLGWPLSASDYTLETSTDLISWTTNSVVPVIVDLQNTVTNSISDAARFYRLKK